MIFQARPWLDDGFQHVHTSTMPKLAATRWLNPKTDLKKPLTYEQMMSGGEAIREAERTLGFQQTPKTKKSEDFQRLARRLFGRSVGLVLGGGAARGVAHLGVLKAMEESGIPIDMIGGNSFGAFVGGLYARNNSLVEAIDGVRALCKSMKPHRFYPDLTLPM
jgi:lysophospholipid hydrolase